MNTIKGDMCYALDIVLTTLFDSVFLMQQCHGVDVLQLPSDRESGAPRGEILTLDPMESDRVRI